ncbi:MAG: hypothetical protein JW925_10850 [Syntrophaceae bacterium]|nr:hypothetical protein [Syntrophaceae bacterium]
MPLLLFYFDATHVYIRHAPSYQYFECALILLLSLYIIYHKNEGRRFRGFGVIVFTFVAIIVFPLMKGVTLDQTLRNFSYVYAAMILLPLSFSYYSKTGNLKKLLFSTFLMIVFYVLFVLYATPQKLGGYASERVAGHIFYFGHMAIRGGVTTIAFVLLMVPLVLASLRKHWQKIVLMIAVGFIFVFFLTILKRFVFVVIGLGLLNYMLQSGLKRKYKIRIVLALLVLVYFIPSNSGVLEVVKDRYEERGGDRRFSMEAVQSDLRIYEPIYVLQNVIKKPIEIILFGERSRVIYDLKHEDAIIKERKIHNTYAEMLSSIGFIGLLLYIFIYYKLYKFVHRIYKIVIKKSKQWLPYWIAFQNMVLIFIVQGMVGGHSHVSLRGLVFLYSGALGGVLYHAYNTTCRNSK